MTPEPVSRPEFERQTLDASNIGDVARPLSLWEREGGRCAALPVST
jgi:hypothetical protein